MTTKARLVALTSGEKDGEAFDVQFNPTSLTIQYRSNTGQQAKGARLPAQYLGLRSVTMGVDLIFDTAEAGTDPPTDVRKLTGRVLAFLDPSKSKKTKTGKAGPPRLKFEWGQFWVKGIVTEASEELDLWSATGVPLRAKVHLSIEGQDPLERKALVSPADGALPGDGQQNAANPDATTAAGTPAPSSAPDRTAAALEGESAASFAARAGLDPRAWRGLALGGSDPISLPAGARIDFASDTRMPPAVTTGFGTGLDGAAPGTAGDVPAEGAEARARQSTIVAGEALAGFVTDTSAARAKPAGRSAAQRAAAAPTATATAHDHRAATFGFGIPLRPRWDVDPAAPPVPVLRAKPASVSPCPCGREH